MRYRRYMLYGSKQERTDALAAIAFWVPLIVLIGVVLFACVGCGTTALKPEEKLVSSVTSLPPVQVPIAAPCIDKVPEIPYVVIDPNATVLQRHYMAKETILAYESALIEWRAMLLGCAAKQPEDKKK